MSARRNLQIRHRRRQKLHRAAKIMRQRVQRARHGLMSRAFDNDFEAYDDRLFRHSARRWRQTVGLADEVEKAERAAGWDPNP